METLRNPGINFPVSGLVAVIATGLLLIFNYNLSKIYIPRKIDLTPKPVFIPYPQTPEPVEIEETETIISEPATYTKKDHTHVSADPPRTIAPIQQGRIPGPGEIKITKIKPGISVQVPFIPEHFTPEQVDQRPRVIRPVTPVYPHQATINGIEGRVVLRFIVDENGEVQNPEVARAEPKGVFEEAALAAIVKYKFIPAKIGKKNVRCIAVMPIGFKIN